MFTISVANLKMFLTVEKIKLKEKSIFAFNKLIVNRLDVVIIMLIFLRFDKMFYILDVKDELGNIMFFFSFLISAFIVVKNIFVIYSVL